jgi:Fe-S-cluster-containing dehydrogenase component
MEKCTGCKLCELACSAVKTGAVNPRDSRLKICLIGIPEIPVPIMLDNCDYCFQNPVCVRFCLPKAIEWEEMESKPERAKVSDAKRIAREWLASVSR